MRIFTFKPRWKEELVCTGPGGQFLLELPMGILSAYLPTEDVWRTIAPEWARALWPDLQDELEQWCKAHNAMFVIDYAAWVVPI